MNVQALTQWTGLLVGLAPALLMLGAFWIVWRTESLHVLTRRLWLIVHGSQDISDPAIRTFVEEQSSLIAFRMFSGIRAGTVEDAQQLLQWAKLNSVSLRTIAECGEYFDVQKRLVEKQRLPSPLMQRAIGALAAVGFVAVVACVSAASVSEVAFSFTSDQRWFLADQSSARVVLPFRAVLVDPLRQTDCKQSPSSLAETKFFSPEQVAILCEMLSHEKWRDHVTAELRAQRVGLISIAAGMLWLTFIWAKWWRSAAVARAMALRRIDPSAIGSQLSLDFSS